MPSSQGPLIPRRRLGAELRRLRERAGLLLDDAAIKLECSASKISRLETGQGIPKNRDVRDLLVLYGVRDRATKDRLSRLADDGRRLGWWHAYAGGIPANVETYVSLESEASKLEAYAGFAVHGLLQTPEYARGAVSENLVQLGIKRQQFVAERARPLDLTVVLDETTLHRIVGSPDVMRDQLRRLLEINESAHTRVLVYPFSAGMNLGVQCSFTIFRFAEDLDRNVVNIELSGGDRYLEQAAEVSNYTTIFDDLATCCPDRSASSELIRRIMNERYPA